MCEREREREVEADGEEERKDGVGVLGYGLPTTCISYCRLFNIAVAIPQSIALAISVTSQFLQSLNNIAEPLTTPPPPTQNFKQLAVTFQA
jgi:hypothetical protein